MKPCLEDIFKLAGVPSVTFVEPVEFARLMVALRTPGRGVIVEGPSKIGKTSAVTKALERLGINSDVLTLSARRPDDLALIRELPSMAQIGIVIIDDFHRLDQGAREEISDYMKLLADEERTDSKVVIIGINRAGESLVSIAPDLAGRVEVIKLGVNPDEKVGKIVDQGSDALNVRIVAREEIIKSAQGSFNIAQALCHDACLSADIITGANELRRVDASYELIRERVLDRLSLQFHRRAEEFAKGKKLRREGRAPYLQILRWLSQSDEWTVDLQKEMSKHPRLRGSVSQVVEKGHLENLLRERADSLGDLLHYDPESRVLAVEDPLFFFYIRNLAWSRFAERLGYLDVSFSSAYDVALSFTGEDRDVASIISEELLSRELAVFYDKNEQSRILAANVEEYLAPIYSTEASYVVAILGPGYPERVWTKFESDQFKHRFGENAIVPIWFSDALHPPFDQSRKIGGFTINRNAALGPQAREIAEQLAARLSADRAEAVRE